MLNIRWCALAVLAVCAAHAESVAGVTWNPPATWKNEGSRPMRAATYAVPATAGDKEPGECVAYYFGKDQGGSVEANIARWKAQFSGPSKTGELTINGLKVTTIEAAGEYSGSGGPMATQKITKPGYRLLGAIVEAPDGRVFFKFTGPEKTVQSNDRAFRTMIGSLRK